jgi:hypothetical protein
MIHTQTLGINQRKRKSICCHPLNQLKEHNPINDVKVKKMIRNSI